MSIANNTEHEDTWANTPDVTLSLVHWLQKTRRGSWLHLLYDASALQDTRLWAFGEDGAFHQRYKTQHEKIAYVPHEHPASSDSYTSYYDERELPLHRPSEGNFIKRHKPYPLRSTRHIFACPTCAGSGHVTCGSCSGTGRCSTCRGQGSTGRGQQSRRCGSCGGNGRCSRCGGSGRVTCSRCDGEGRLLKYTSKDYKWWFDEDQETILSDVVDRFGVRGLIKKARKTEGSVQISEFSEAEVLRTTGVINDRIRDVILLATSRQKEIERTIAERSDLIVFQETYREYVPLSYINLSVAQKYGQFFAAGTEAHSEVRRPPIPISAWKASIWLSLMATVLLLAFGNVNTTVSIALLVGWVGLAGVGGWATLRGLKQPIPARWLILDDKGHGAWQLAYLVAQAVSRAGIAHIRDPWFTALLEPPNAHSVKSRNSFMYTMLHNGTTSRTEVIVVGDRAQKQYAQDVEQMMETATRLSWIAGTRTAQELDGLIAEVMERLSEESRKAIEVTVVFDQQTASTAADQFPKTQEQVSAERFRVVTAPMERMCSETLSGIVSEQTHYYFQKLIERGGFSFSAAGREDPDLQTELKLPDATFLARDELNDGTQPEATSGSAPIDLVSS